MHRIAIIKVSDYLSYHYDDNSAFPPEAITDWYDVNDEEYQMLLEESDRRQSNRRSQSGKTLDQFMVIEQETNPRQFIENTVGARLEEVRQQAAEREAENARKRASAHAAAEKKRLAQEAKERAEFEKLAKKFGKFPASASGHEQLDLLS